MGFVIRRGNKLVAKRMCGGQARVQICVGNPCRSRRWVPPVGCTDHLWPPLHLGKEFQRQPFSARRLKSSNEARAIGHHRRLQLTTTTSFPQQRLNQKNEQSHPASPSTLSTSNKLLPLQITPPPPGSRPTPHRAAKDGFPRCLLGGLRYVMIWGEKRKKRSKTGG